MSKDPLTPDSWLKILASAYSLFEDSEARGFGTPPFALGGGTVRLPFAEGMIGKVRDFVLKEIEMGSRT